MTGLEVRRLGRADRALARATFTMMAEVFDEAPSGPLGDEHLDALLGAEAFWALCALVGSQVVGGITAHTLPMTRSESSELFVDDLAVRAGHRRQGVATALVGELRAAAAAAGVHEVFVPADDEDQHALEFYRAQGAAAAAVTIFTFPPAPLREPPAAPSAPTAPEAGDGEGSS